MREIAHLCTVIAAVALAVGYNYFAAFYRASARELKRIGKFIVTLDSHVH